MNSLKDQKIALYHPNTGYVWYRRVVRKISIENGLMSGTVKINDIWLGVEKEISGKYWTSDADWRDRTGEIITPRDISDSFLQWKDKTP
jgi:hypothetical protein